MIGWWVVPLDDKERKRKSGEGQDQISNETLKKRDWEDCLLVRQVTPNDHNTMKRGNDGTLDAE